MPPYRPAALLAGLSPNVRNVLQVWSALTVAKTTFSLGYKQSDVAPRSAGARYGEQWRWRER